MEPSARTAGTLCAAALLVAGALVHAADGPPLPPGLDASQTQPAGRSQSPDEPALPAGLTDGDDEGEPTGPALPEGLGDGQGEADGAGPPLPGGLEGDGEGPSLPAGIDDGGAPADGGTAEREKEESAFVDWLNPAGFWEVRGGVRTQRDPYEKDASLGETRLQLEATPHIEDVTFTLKADFLYDAVAEHHTVELDRGDGWLDLREANVAFTPFKFMDVKAGRQILTWGTGDLIFLNDLFPKDWVSFFVGRDVDYLKAPSDAIKMSFFTDVANVDFVYTPSFDADRFITGRRISYYNAALASRAGRNAIVDADVPNEWFDDQEFATRVSKNVRGYELAGYGYWGFWKSPAGRDPADGDATFPRLSVYGGSVRGQFARGIGNLEVAYYDSRQDRDGDDPFVNNSELRLLAGYEQDLKEVARDLTVGGQYYLERMMDYGDYRRTLPPGVPARDQCRQVLTLRVTKLLMNQTLQLSMFAFYSPTDNDAYLRPRISYDITDEWTVELGGNVFVGARNHTFFGQFENNSNVYTSLRYGF